MNNKLLALLLVILTIGGGLEGQGLKPNKEMQLKYGFLIGPGGCSIDEQNKEGANWSTYPCFLVGGLARKPLFSWLEAQVEIQFVSRTAFRVFNHPQPYVYDMKVKIHNKLLRFPVSLLISQPLGHGFPTTYLGGGGTLAIPLEVTMTEELHYNDYDVFGTKDIREDYCHPVVAYQGIIGLRESGLFSEIRFGYDHSSFKAPGLGLNKLNQWDMWWLFGFTN